MTDLTDEQYADWMENAEGGQGPTPTASLQRSDLETLVAAVKRSATMPEEQVARAVAIVRARGASWSAIGWALGLSRQGAHRKYARRSLADSSR